MKIWLVSWQLRPPALIRDWLLDLFAWENQERRFNARLPGIRNVN